MPEKLQFTVFCNACTDHQNKEELHNLEVNPGNTHISDQCHCFHYRDSTIPLLSKFENVNPLTIFCGCTAPFVLDLVGNPEDIFSRNAAHISLSTEEPVLRLLGYTLPEACNLGIVYDWVPGSLGAT